MLRIAHQRGTGAAAYQTDAGPQVGGDFQVVATPVMQRCHAPLAFGVEAREGFLRGFDGLVADVLDQFVRSLPRLFGGLANDDVQANAELHLASMASGTFTYIGEFFGNGGGRFAPGQVHVDLLGSEVMRRVGRAAEIQRRIRFLHRRIQGFGVLHFQVLALEIHRFALQHPAPDPEEFVGDFVAFAVAQEAAVATVFVGVAAGHHVDQQTTVGQSIERRRHARRNGGRNDPRADRYQITQAFGQRHQRRGDHPRVFAGATGGNQHAVIAEAVGGLRHLFQIIQGDRARALGGAQVMAVAVGRQEPENIHEQLLKRFSATV